MKTIHILPICLILSGCSGNSQTKNSDTDSVIVMEYLVDDSVCIDTVSQVVVQPQTALETDDNHFSTASEAYNEGYINGEQEGYTDATHHLAYGYNYDDTPTYSGFARSYAEGYEDGYDEGYDQGQEWNEEND